MSVRRALVLVLLFSSACAFDPLAGLECESADEAPGRECVEGVWVVSNDLDADSDDSASNVVEPDISPDLCEAESDEELCASVDAECGPLSTVDRCGENREVACGTCTGDDACVDNACSCVEEDVDDFCSRQQRDCGEVTGPDNCVDERVENCGTCDDGIVCGEEQRGVCGCPCLIAGTCVPEGQRNPEAPCFVCDPDRNDSDWSIAEGQTCDDEDACTTGDICDAAGDCAGTALDCSDRDSACATGMCDPNTGTCTTVDLPDDTDCTDDGLPCTDDVCRAGDCVHDVAEDKCLIVGVCYDMGATNPPCEECDPTTDKRSWTPTPGQSCMTDSLDCTTQECSATGSCDATIEPTSCAVDDACYADGEASPTNDCETCQPSLDQTDFNPSSGNSCDDGRSCTVDDSCRNGACDQFASITDGTCFIEGQCLNDGQSPAGGSCRVCDSENDQTDWSAVDGSCLIGDRCFITGDLDPSNDCMECSSDDDKYAFTPLSDGTECGTEAGCECDAGQCVKTSDGSACS